MFWSQEDLGMLLLGRKHCKSPLRGKKILPHFRDPFALRLRMRHSSLYIYFSSQLSFHTLLTMSTLQRPRRIDLYQVRTGGR
jgi:hypothetical protein